MPPGPKEGDLAHDMSHEAVVHKRIHTDKGESGLYDSFVRMFSCNFCKTSKSKIHMSCEGSLDKIVSNGGLWFNLS